MENHIKVFVKTFILNKQKVYGITNGKKWFFYAYQSENIAYSMLKYFQTSTSISLNITSLEPRQLI